MDKKTILIAEDTESNFMYLNILLRSKYNILRAHNGQEAADIFLKENPPIVMLDIKMPETDGLYALEAIRKVNQEVPIIMQTAYAFDSDVERAMSLGATAYLTKPIMKEKLNEVLEKYDK